MSADWGGVSPDRYYRDVDAGPASPSELEPDLEAGAWPEDMNERYLAESSMSLPGKGSPGKNCQEWFPKEFCDECGEPHLGVSRCEQRTCPNCWGAWTRRRAEKIARRLGAARYAQPDGIERRAIHAVVSAPEGEIRTLNDVKQGYRDAYELAKEKGVRGGVVVFHGFRATASTKELYSKAVRAGDWDTGDDGKIWSFIRSREKRLEREIGSGEDWRELTYWSPHWHVIGLSTEFEADDPDEQDGWVARRIRSLESFQLHDDEAYDDMVGATRYLLSHASFETGTSKDCVRWFGDLSTTKFSPEQALSEGSLSVVERKAKEAAESHDERGEGAAEDEQCGNCGSQSRSPIWDAGGALCDPGWCERIGRDQERKLQAAFEWAIGDRQPPPGMKHPQTEEQAEEALEALL
jgi:hypothetical protein